MPPGAMEAPAERVGSLRLWLQDWHYMYNWGHGQVWLIDALEWFDDLATTRIRLARSCSQGMLWHTQVEAVCGLAYPRHHSFVID